jgi:hypothetical protein
MYRHSVVTQVGNWKQSLKAVDHTIASSADTIGASITGCDAGNLHRPTIVPAAIAGSVPVSWPLLVMVLVVVLGVVVVVIVVLVLVSLRRFVFYPHGLVSHFLLLAELHSIEAQVWFETKD